MTVTIVAEIGTNWQPSNLQSALDMVRVAAECGADVVKFQDWRVDAMDRPDEWKERCRPWDMKAEWVYALAAEAKAHNLQFTCSVWDYQSVKRSRGLRYEAVKVASSEIGHQSILRRLNAAPWDIGPAVWLSIPHDRPAAVIPALTWLPDCAVTLLHCVAQYPAERTYPEAFDRLKEFGLPVGWSSHVPFPRSTEAAVYFAERGAVVIEAHLRTVDTPDEAPDNGPWALYPEQFAELVKAVRNV